MSLALVFAHFNFESIQDSPPTFLACVAALVSFKAGQVFKRDDISRGGNRGSERVGGIHG